jgi:hypothetical protein
MPTPTIVRIKGCPLVSIVYRPLTPEERERVERALLHRADQLTFNIDTWRRERQAAGDAAGIREQLRFYGPGKVWGKGGKRERAEESKPEEAHA